MDSEAIYLIFLCVLIVAVLFLIVYFGSKKDKNTAPVKSEEELNREYEYQKIHAKVTDLSCNVLSEGYRSPKTFKEFTVTFETDNGKTLKLHVSEEMYDGFEKGQVGILTVVDGQFYSFELC
ncbi:MAG: DUF2500 family protein [Clostridia bacterium]|nr:DUF2500 family protein [Clostridia bacterium]